MNDPLYGMTDPTDHLFDHADDAVDGGAICVCGFSREVHPTPVLRARLRKALKDHGVRIGRSHQLESATIVEYVDWWGIMPGVDVGSTVGSVTAALDRAGIVWRLYGYQVQVAKLRDP